MSKDINFETPSAFRPTVSRTVSSNLCASFLKKVFMVGEAKNELSQLFSYLKIMNLIKFKFRDCSCLCAL